MWQLRSTSTMSPGWTSACTTILLAVEVPLVTKNVLREPNVVAARCCASRSGPVGSSSESRPPHVADVSARKTSRP